MTKPDYDHLWHGRWGGMQDIGPVHRHSAQVIIDLLRPLGVRSLADIGCGNGANLAAIQGALHLDRVAGFDLSPRALDVARTRVPEGTFEQIDLEETSPPGRFDAVLSAQVIEHLEDDDAFLAGLRAMTGRWCIVATVSGRMRESEKRIGHLRNYTRAGLEAQMRAVGLEPVKTVEWGWPFYSPLYRSAIEYVGGQAAELTYRGRDRLVAAGLYQLYRLNRSTRGDVLTILAEAR